MTVLTGLIYVAMVVVIPGLSILCSCHSQRHCQQLHCQSSVATVVAFQTVGKGRVQRGVQLTVLRPRPRVVHITNSTHIPCSMPSHMAMHNCRGGWGMYPAGHPCAQSQIHYCGRRANGSWLTITVFVATGQQFYFTVVPAGILGISYGDFHLRL